MQQSLPEREGVREGEGDKYTGRQRKRTTESARERTFFI
jgi:hypothetical protein